MGLDQPTPVDDGASSQEPPLPQPTQKTSSEEDSIRSRHSDDELVELGEHLRSEYKRSFESFPKMSMLQCFMTPYVIVCDFDDVHSLDKAVRNSVEDRRLRFYFGDLVEPKLKVNPNEPQPVAASKSERSKFAVYVYEYEFREESGFNREAEICAWKFLALSDRFLIDQNKEGVGREDLIQFAWRSLVLIRNRRLKLEAMVSKYFYLPRHRFTAFILYHIDNAVNPPVDIENSDVKANVEVNDKNQTNDKKAENGN